MPRDYLCKWSMFPEFHEKVSSLLMEDNLSFEFYETDDDENYIKTYDSHIMGKFVCRNRNCATNGWSSKHIAITIRMYSEERYNARVYSQCCKTCKAPSRPLLNEKSYAERVAYRIKKWNGIELEPPSFAGTSQTEHEMDLCEGCKAGRCNGPYL